MPHTLKKKVTLGQFSSRHQKIARLHSGNTIIAKALLKAIDKEKVNGAKDNKEK